MSNNKKTAKSMLLISALSLAGCASSLTLDFTIPPEKLGDFKLCMVGLGQNKDIAELGRNYLSKLVLPGDQPTSLLNMLDDFRNNFIDLADKQHQSVAFDMHTQWLWFFDSEIKKVVEDISNPANIFPILQPENLATDISTIPGRIAKAQKAYLLAYFTVSQDKNGGFISRDGTIFKFPVEDIQGEGISSVDHSQIGADIIRIILEAIRDGSLDKCNALPAVSAATGVKAHLLREITDAKENNKECESERIWKIPAEDYLSNMQARVNAAESMIATAAGKAMRGGSMGSLDNEALARLRKQQ